MKIEYDEAKRQHTLAERGLDFEDARIVLSNPVVRQRDDRFDYGEVRWITAGKLRGDTVVLVLTDRGDATRIISMRMANERERREYARAVGRPG